MNCSSNKRLLYKRYGKDFSIIGIKQNGQLYHYTNSYKFGEEKNTILSWRDIKSVVLVGADGPVLCSNSEGKILTSNTEHFSRYHEDIFKWTNIKEIVEVGTSYVGLKNDGTLVVSLSKYKRQEGDPEWYGSGDTEDSLPDWCCKIQEWKDIVHIESGKNFVAGLKSNGEVLIVTISCPEHIYDISNWNDIQNITCNGYAIAGVRKNGSIVMTGKLSTSYNSMDYDIDFDVSGWYDIKSVQFTQCVIVGVKYDGTIIYSFSDENHPSYPIIAKIPEWKNINEVLLLENYDKTELIIGVQNNGEIVASHFIHGGDYDIQKLKENVIQWNLS